MIEDIRYLIVFAKIVEVGSISGGAEALGVSAATASLQLSKLEKNTGSALLYRNTRKLSLTHDGACLFDTAKSMLELYEKGFIEFKRRSISMRNNLHISIPALFINSVFMRYLSSFIKRNSGVSLKISCSDIRHDIIAESIDVAFRIGDLPDSSLKARHLFLLPRKVVAGKEFLNAHDPIKHPRDLEKMKWIGLSMRANSRIFRHKNGKKVEIKYSPQIQVDNVEASYQLAKQQLGLVAPPVYLIEDNVKNGSVEIVLPDWTLDPLKVYAVWPPNVSTNSVAYELINHIYDSFSSTSLC